MAEMTPRVKLLPVGLLNTRLPWARRIAASIFVVVVFPLVPVTTTIPSRHPRQGVREELRVDPLGHEARHRRTPTPDPGRGPGRLARNDRGGGPEHAPNPNGVGTSGSGYVPGVTITPALPTSATRTSCS